MSDVAHWEESYRSGNAPWDTGRCSSELIRVVREHKIQPCRTVELGCGTGTNSIWLAQQGWTVTGFANVTVCQPVPVSAVKAADPRSWPELLQRFPM